MEANHPRDRRMIHRNPGTTLDPIRLRHVAQGIDLYALIHDLSILGMGVLAPQNLVPGLLLIVEPGSRRRQLATELFAEVRHATSFDRTQYLVGCRFSRYLTLEDVAALG